MELKVDQKVKAHLKVVDKFGNEVKALVGVPVWSTSVPVDGLCSLVVAVDGLSADLVPVGPLGALDLIVGASVADGLKSVTAHIDLVAGSPDGLSLAFDAPVQA